MDMDMGIDIDIIYQYKLMNWLTLFITVTNTLMNMDEEFISSPSICSLYQLGFTQENRNQFQYIKRGF